MRFPPGANHLAVAAVVAVVILGAALSAMPSFKTQLVGGGGGAGGTSVSGPGGLLPSIGPDISPLPGQVIGSPQPGSSAAAVGGLQAPPPGVACAPGRNGGATDKGVTANQINLASTLAESGEGASFLGDARFGILAVASAVNRAGGICGRRLNLNLVDDSWNPQTGQSDIRNFINESVFALAVVPSSEGLNAASRAGDIDAAGIPVVGTDGMLYSQYKDPWIWPVATSTISTAHIAALSASKAGSHTFGIIWDNKYKFGQEGHAAFVGAVARLGGTLNADVSVPPGQQDYGTQVSEFENQSGSHKGCAPCDFTFMLLQPDTAVAVIRSDASQGHYVFGSNPKMGTAGPQPLFVSSFGQGCGALCNNMWVWTGYKAAYPPFDGEAPVAAYSEAIKSVSGSADTANQFLEGSYVGMGMLVNALQAVGPYLTRARLKQQLDSMRYDSGLSKPLAWTSGNHFANTSMLGFTIQYSQGFNGFQYQQTDWVQDPWPNLDHP
ncbi:MAG: ABC transporter substrate-binding protein [Candidatus Dormibacteria bacterium]